jgi:DNA-binding protein H-NS
MSTFDEIQSQIALVQSEAQARVAELQKQAASARKEAMAGAIRSVKELMAQHGLTLADLGFAGAKVLKSKVKSGTDNRSAVAIKYKDQSTGETWTGRGKTPKWMAAKLASGASKEQFLV